MQAFGELSQKPHKIGHSAPFKSPGIALQNGEARHLRRQKRSFSHDGRCLSYELAPFSCTLALYIYIKMTDVDGENL